MRYNRELMSTTLKTMERVEEVRKKRELVFTRNRLRPKQEAEKALAIGQLEKNVALAANQPARKTETIKVAKAKSSKQMELDS